MLKQALLKLLTFYLNHVSSGFSCIWLVLRAQESFLTSYKKKQKTNKQTNKQRPCMSFCFFNIFILNISLWAWICYVINVLKWAFLKLQKIYHFTLLYLGLFSCFACPGEFLLVSFFTSYKKRSQKAFQEKTVPSAWWMKNFYSPFEMKTCISW